MRIIAGVVLLTAAAGAGASEEKCQVVIEIEKLQLREIDGREVYVLEADSVDKSQCYKAKEVAKAFGDLRTDHDRCMKQLNEDLALCRNMHDLANQGGNILNKYKATLDSAILLGTKYQSLVADYGTLTSKYDALTVKFDNLAGDYRDLVSTRSSFSLDVGLGYGGDGPMGLVGVGISKYKVWGFLQDGNNGVLVGTSVGY